MTIHTSRAIYITHMGAERQSHLSQIDGSDSFTFDQFNETQVVQHNKDNRSTLEFCKYFTELTEQKSQ